MKPVSAKTANHPGVADPGHPPLAATPGLCRYPRDPKDWAKGLCGKPGAGTCSTDGETPCAEHGPAHGIGWHPEEVA